MSAAYTIGKPPESAVRIAIFSVEKHVRLTVLTPASTVRLAHDRGSLESPPPYVGTSGMIITDTDRQNYITWQGEMWALGDATNAGNVAMEVDTGANILPT